MKNEPININDDLLVKHLLGEASAAEAQAVEEWINNNTNNKKHYNDLKLLWDASKGLAAKSTVNADAAWERFRNKTQPKVIHTTLGKSYNWLKIAALLILLAGSGSILFLNQKNNPIAAKKADISEKIVNNETLVNKSQIINNEQLTKNKETNDTAPIEEVVVVKKQQKTPKMATYAKYTISKNIEPKHEQNISKGVICNNTPTPIEICITQTIKCNGQPSTISTCSTLEPDQEGKLHYKSHDKLGKHCTMSIDEITIKTLSTGETIVLNANSHPSTAQEFFKYITSPKKGDVVAGVLRDNCDDDQDCGLKLDNNFGDLILQ